MHTEFWWENCWKVSSWITEKEIMVYQQIGYSGRCELGRTDSVSCHMNWILAISGL
jgi:hypothetical protein